jgi:hypothetical protein
MLSLKPDEIFRADFTPEPLWWSDAPPERAALRPLPPRVDVAVIGSGWP